MSEEHQLIQLHCGTWVDPRCVDVIHAQDDEVIVYMSNGCKATMQFATDELATEARDQIADDVNASRGATHDGGPAA